MTSESREARHEPDAERVYRNGEIEVTWAPSLCIHWGACVRGSDQVFDPQRRPWVDVDAEAPARIAEIIDGCPTGALHARLVAEGVQVETGPEAVIAPQQDGPLFIRGRVRIVAPNGEVLREDTRVALCRCGASQNKPFCDDSHYRIGFKS